MVNLIVRESLENHVALRRDAWDEIADDAERQHATSIVKIADDIADAYAEARLRYVLGHYDA